MRAILTVFRSYDRAAPRSRHLPVMPLKWWAWSWRPAQRLSARQLRAAEALIVDIDARAGVDGIICRQWEKWPDAQDLRDLLEDLLRIAPGHFRIAPFSRDCTCTEGEEPEADYPCALGSISGCGQIRWRSSDWLPLEETL